MEREKEGFPITSLREINTLLKAQHPNIVTVRVGVLCCAQADRPRNTLYNVHVPKKNDYIRVLAWLLFASQRCNVKPNLEFLF